MAKRKKEALFDAFCAGKSARSQRTVTKADRVSSLSREAAYRWFRACAVLEVGPKTTPQPLAVTLATGDAHVGVVLQLHATMRRAEIAFGEGRTGEEQLRLLVAKRAPGALWRDPDGNGAAIHLDVKHRVVRAVKKPDRTVPYVLVPTAWRSRSRSEVSCAEELVLWALADVVRPCPAIPVKYLRLYLGEALLRFASRNGRFDATLWDLITTTSTHEVRRILRRRP
jgi:hypothetical protein